MHVGNAAALGLVGDDTILGMTRRQGRQSWESGDVQYEGCGLGGWKWSSPSAKAVLDVALFQL